MLAGGRPKPLEVVRTKRDGATSSRASGRVGEAHEFLALVVGQKLHDRGEALFARPLRNAELVDDVG